LLEQVFFGPLISADDLREVLGDEPVAKAKTEKKAEDNGTISLFPEATRNTKLG
jgi:hypothetical protein